ncbi:VWA domain-containing protein [Bacillus atrophaeus]|uniref:VWA domain-containing protein n=1 Tax=Bacillus atrophaeus TaxID=1452 RepID=UPI002E205366|nr:VWA domain-containing protein [Bacillus atrophaeus]
MDKLQEIKGRISKLKGYQNAKPEDQYWMAKEHIDFLIYRTELSVKQQEIIEENKRQQEVTVNQFRQAREEIQRLRAEKKKIEKKFKKAIKEIRDIRDVAGKSTGAYLFAKNALVALEGDAE